MTAMAVNPDVRARDRWFYVGVGLFLALVAFTGFAKSFYLSPWFEPPRGTPPYTPILWVHGAVFTLWPILGVVQPALIAGRNPALHRKVGYFGAAVAVLMVVLGNLAAIAAMHGGFIGLGDPHAFYAIPFFGINLFGALVLLAVLNRHKPEVHKRLMVIASSLIIEAAFARFQEIQPWAPFSFFLLSNLVIVAGMVWDLSTRRRIHPVWIWGGLAVLASQALRLLVANTEPWLAFARFMASLWPA